MKSTPLLIICIALLFVCGCNSRSAKSKSTADVWHIGEALDRYNTDLPGETLQLMGKSLKQISEQQAKDGNFEIDKNGGKQ